MTLSVSIDLVSSSARVTSVKFQKHHLRRDIRTQRSDQGHLGPIKIQITNSQYKCRIFKGNLFHFNGTKAKKWHPQYDQRPKTSEANASNIQQCSEPGEEDYVKCRLNLTELPLILLRELSDEGLHAKVPPHEGSLAGGAGHHCLLLAAWLADLVALQDKVYISDKNRFLL